MMIHRFFNDYDDIVAHTDGSSLNNPGSVRKITFILLIVWFCSRFYGKEKSPWHRKI